MKGWWILSPVSVIVRNQGIIRWRGLSCGSGIVGFNAFPPNITKHITKHITSHPTHSPFFNQTRPFQALLVVHISGGVFSVFVFLDRDILPQVVLAHLVHVFSWVSTSRFEVAWQARSQTVRSWPCYILDSRKKSQVWREAVNIRTNRTERAMFAHHLQPKTVCMILAPNQLASYSCIFEAVQWRKYVCLGIQIISKNMVFWQPSTAAAKCRVL